MAKRGPYAKGPFEIRDGATLARKPNYHYPEDESIAEHAIALKGANPENALTGIVEALVVKAKLQPRVSIESHVRRIMRRIARSRTNS